MYFRLRARYEAEKRLGFSESEAGQKGLYLHRMLDVDLRRFNREATGDGGVQPVLGYGIVPMADQRKSYPAGGTFEFDVNVFAANHDAMQVTVAAMSGFALMGKDPAQARLRLTRISAIRPGHLPAVLYDIEDSHGFIEPDDLEIGPDELCEPIPEACGALVLETVTPIAVKDKATKIPKLGWLVRSILRQCEGCWPDALPALTRHVSRDTLEAHADKLERSAGMVANELSRIAQPFSYKSMKSGFVVYGYAGRITLNRDWQPLLPLLRVGSWIQTGGRSAFGFGVYHLHIAEPIMP